MEDGLVVKLVERKGGLALLWRVAHTVELNLYFHYHIHVKVSGIDGGPRWWLIGFYGMQKLITVVVQETNYHIYIRTFETLGML